MSSAIAITRTDLSACELRAASARSSNSAAARRMLALALVLEGVDRERAAQRCGMQRKTLRDWVHRYNAHGLDGPINRKAPGVPPARLQASASIWPLLCKQAQIRRRTASHGGAGSICRNRSRNGSGSRCMSARLASTWRRWVTANFRCARSIPNPIPRTRKLSKKTLPTR